MCIRDSDHDERGDAAQTGQGAGACGEHRETDEAAEHVDVAVGEVEQLDDPVDHRVAQGHQTVERADEQSVEHQLQVVVHRSPDRVGGGGNHADAGRSRPASAWRQPYSVSYTHLDVYKRQNLIR